MKNNFLMRGPLLALCFLAFSLGWLVFFGAGSRLADWSAVVLFSGAIALFYWTFRTGQTPPRLPLWQVLALWALPLYAGFQLIPLPAGLLEFLSPARALINQSLAAVMKAPAAAPLSVAPAQGWIAFFSLLGFLTIFALLRDTTWRLAESLPWVVAAPIVGLAAMQAMIGLVQWIGSPASAEIRGTLASRDSFAALLEVALPFTLVFSFISFRRHQTLQAPSMRPALTAAASLGTSVLLVIALFRARSAASLLVCLSSLFIGLAFAVIPRLKTKKLRLYGAWAATALALAGLLFATPPFDFINALSQWSTDQAADRLTLWSNSATLFSDFHWLGAGMGGFETIYPKYQGTAILHHVTDPGSDALALLISFGIAGACMVGVALTGVFRSAILGALHLPGEPRRLLAVCSVAALSAALLRSFLDATLTVPAIAMVFAWLAGLAQSSGVD